MNNKISTDDLFHYTSFSNLLGIIANGFYPRYSLEFTLLSDLFDRQINMGLFPMACFCDIPLNLVGAHADKYGTCAIGLKKNWGQKHGLNPVFYIDPNSATGDAFGAIADNFANYKSNMISNDSNYSIFNIIGGAIKGFNHLSYFVKQFERPNTISININGHSHLLEQRRFYDEREWRFVPIRTDLLGDLPLVNPADYFDPEKIKEHNRMMEKYVLPFHLDEISYIIYEEIEQLNPIIEALEKKYNVALNDLDTKPDILTLKEITALS